MLRYLTISLLAHGTACGVLLHACLRPTPTAPRRPARIEVHLQQPREVQQARTDAPVLAIEPLVDDAPLPEEPELPPVAAEPERKHAPPAANPAPGPCLPDIADALQPLRRERSRPNEQATKSPPQQPPPAADTALEPVANHAPTPAVGCNEPPSYPAAARRRGWQGTVLLRVRCDANGAVVAVEIALSSGFALLDDAARDAVASWRFDNGPGVAEQPITFRLGRG